MVHCSKVAGDPPGVVAECCAASRVGVPPNLAAAALSPLAYGLRNTLKFLGNFKNFALIFGFWR